MPRLDAVREVVDAAEHGGEPRPGRCVGAVSRARRSATPPAKPTRARSNALRCRNWRRRFESRLTDFVGGAGQALRVPQGVPDAGRPEASRPGQLAFLARSNGIARIRIGPTCATHWRSILQALLAAERLSPVALDDGPRSVRRAMRWRRHARLARVQPPETPVRQRAYKPLATRPEVQGDRRRVPPAQRTQLGGTGAGALHPKDVFKEISGTGSAEIAKAPAGRLLGIRRRSRRLQVTPAADLRRARAVRARLHHTWDEFLSDITLADRRRTRSKAATFSASSAAAARLESVLGIVSDNTKLSRPERGGRRRPLTLAKRPGKAGQRSRRSASILQGAQPGAVAAKREAAEAVTDHFADLHQLVRDRPVQAPIDRTVERGSGRCRSASAAWGRRWHRRRCQVPHVRRRWRRSRAPRSRSGPLPAAVAAVLSPAVGGETGLVRGQGAGRTGGTLSGPGRRRVPRNHRQGRYPFSRGRDKTFRWRISLDCSARAACSTVLQANLATFIDTSHSLAAGARPRAARWTCGHPFLMQFELVERIRQQFFAPAERARTAIHAVARVPGCGGAEFHAGGQWPAPRVRHGPQQRWPAKWPSDAGEQVVVTFDSGQRARAEQGLRRAVGCVPIHRRCRTGAATDTRFLLTVTAGGQSARLLLEARPSGIRSPIRCWRSFAVAVER